jgi:hypothetical protein
LFVNSSEVFRGFLFEHEDDDDDDDESEELELDELLDDEIEIVEFDRLRFFFDFSSLF